MDWELLALTPPYPRPEGRFLLSPSSTTQGNQPIQQTILKMGDATLSGTVSGQARHHPRNAI